MKISIYLSEEEAKSFIRQGMMESGAFKSIADVRFKVVRKYIDQQERESNYVLEEVEVVGER